MEFKSLVTLCLEGKQYLTKKELAYVLTIQKKGKASDAEVYALSDLATRVGKKEYSPDERQKHIDAKEKVYGNQPVQQTNTQSQKAAANPAAKAADSTKAPKGDASKKASEPGRAGELDKKPDEDKKK